MRKEVSSLREPIRVLVVDDELAVRESYALIFNESNRHENENIKGMRSRLFGEQAMTSTQVIGEKSNEYFIVKFCSGAEAAVKACQLAFEKNERFNVMFIDMRMPPGPDGLWAAEKIRAIDGDIEIVFCTAFSDVDVETISRRVPPADKLFYLQKPFSSHAVRALAIALGHKWSAHRRIAKLAYFDALTGLPNRNLFNDQLAMVIDRAIVQNSKFAVLYFDLDNFKRVNDTLGHAVGDELLCTLSERILDLLAKDGLAKQKPILAESKVIFGRMSGDEFVVLLNDISSVEEVRLLASRLVSAMQQPVMLSLHHVMTTTSVGVAVYPTNGESAEQLFRNADLAMYCAKRQGPGRIAFFEDAMNEDGLRRLTLEAGLREALANNELQLYYQPQFNINDSTIEGFEALLRWNSADYGSISPAEFIPLAEETGLILQLGKWVLRTACEQMKRWCDQGLCTGRIAVNVSALQLAQADFLETVISTLRDTGLSAHFLEIEVTETILMSDEARSIAVCARLRDIGVSVAIDDFGTGYSSLSRLRNFAVDRIKIDRSFLQDMHNNNEDRILCNAIIRMGQTLGLKVVAEGVENFSQLLLLQEEKCELAQGYLFAKPLTVFDAEQLLQKDVEARDLTRTRRMAVLIAKPQAL